MLKTDQTFSPSTPGHRLLTGRRQVDTLFATAIRPDAFRGVAIWEIPASL